MSNVNPAPTSPAPAPLLRIEEVARLVSVHPRTIQRWVREQEFPRPIRLPGGRVRWTRETVSRWLAQRARAADEA